MSTDRNRVVSASDVAGWAWCPESWRLEALGAEPGHAAARARGEAHHAANAAFEAFSRRVAACGVLLLALALLVVALGFLLTGGQG